MEHYDVSRKKNGQYNKVERVKTHHKKPKKRLCDGDDGVFGTQGMFKKIPLKKLSLLERLGLK